MIRTFREETIEVEAFRGRRRRQLSWRGSGCREWKMALCTIVTPEAHITANPGDWIIQGVKGESYPCHPDIFVMTYDLVGAGAGAAI